MNYFAHGRAFADDPYFLAGTAVPDWLNVSDRGVRVRSKQALPFGDDDDPRLSALARGIVRHHRDDAWFHETRAFAELSWQLTGMVRDGLAPDDGLRPSFLGHILVELLLDDCLIADSPAELEAYYRAVLSLDAGFVQQAVCRMSGREAGRLEGFIGAFVREQFLWDYADDAKLWYRLNQVMRRVGLALLPEEFCRLLPEARRLVADRRAELLCRENQGVK